MDQSLNFRPKRKLFLMVLSQNDLFGAHMCCEHTKQDIQNRLRGQEKEDGKWLWLLIISVNFIVKNIIFDFLNIITTLLKQSSLNCRMTNHRSFMSQTSLPRIPG